MGSKLIPNHKACEAEAVLREPVEVYIRRMPEGLHDIQYIFCSVQELVRTELGVTSKTIEDHHL